MVPAKVRVSSDMRATATARAGGRGRHRGAVCVPRSLPVRTLSRRERGRPARASAADAHATPVRVAPGVDDPLGGEIAAAIAVGGGTVDGSRGGIIAVIGRARGERAER